MSDGPEEQDPGANTERFRAFVESGDGQGPAQRGGTGSSFRVWSLIGGLVLFVLIAWLLLRA